MTIANEATAQKTSGRAVLSMRLIVTVVTVLLVAGAVIGTGGMMEREVRDVLTRELETRLVLEARNLAHVSANALLGDFPELTLHPVLKDIDRQRPELSLLAVVDHQNIIQGHADASQLGEPLVERRDLVPIDGDVSLLAGESLQQGGNLVVVTTPILHPSGLTIGRALVGMERTHIDALIADARRNLGMVLAAVLAAALLLTPLCISFLLRPIRTLRAALERIGRGDLDARLKMSNRTELGVLAGSINDMAFKLKSAQDGLLEKERLDHEMQLARDIQRSLLPAEPVRCGTLTMQGAQEAADEVGGDYYDVFELMDGRQGVVVADVAGKGLGGCLVTSMIAVLIRTLAPAFSSPSQMLVALHDALQGYMRPGMFVTMFYGMIDATNGRVSYASAGHNPVLHYEAESGATKWLRTTGVPLGLLSTDIVRTSLKDYSLHLNAGDMLVQYTDGFNEAMNDAGEQFGFERMEEVVGRNIPKGPEAVSNGLFAALNRWESSALDDKTLLVVGRDGVTASHGAAGAPRTDSQSARQATASAHREDPRRATFDQLWSRRLEGRGHLRVYAQLDDLKKIGSWLGDCVDSSLSEAELGQLEQGLFEIVSNIAEHGCGLDAEKAIDLWWLTERHGGGREDNELRAVLIRDKGTAPQVESWPMVELTSNRVQKEGRGLGLLIIGRTFESVEFYTDEERGNLTVAEFRLPLNVSS